MGKYKDLTGLKFGKLFVIERDKKPEGLMNDGSVFWLCKCDCGNTAIVRSYSLTSGRTKSCGCYVKEFKVLDLINKRFGKLVVKEKSDKRDKWGNVYWLCECDCGNEKVVRGRCLTCGETKSCGCARYDSRFKLGDGIASQNELFRCYKYNAKKRNIEFNLEKEYFLEITQRICFYCGDKPNNIMKNNCNTGEYIYNGVDRIDSSLGYIRNNVVPCCKKCNGMKMDISLEDWLKQINKIYNHSIKNKILE